MLVLKRHQDETIQIGDDVTVTVVEVAGNSVKLGIKAPPHVPVHRGEVVTAIISEGRTVRDCAPEPAAWHQHHPNVVALVRWLMSVEPMTADEVQTIYEAPEIFGADWNRFEEAR